MKAYTKSRFIHTHLSMFFLMTMQDHKSQDSVVWSDHVVSPPRLVTSASLQTIFKVGNASASTMNIHVDSYI